MLETTLHKEKKNLHSDDMQDVITSVPSWIIKWGITLFALVLALIFSLSAIIHYPDIVKTAIKIESPNSPKPVTSRISGKLVKLLIKDDAIVTKGQPLAYMESIASHSVVLKLLMHLQFMQQQINYGNAIDTDYISNNFIPQLGELQVPYQSFIQAYLNYKSAISNGLLLKKQEYLKKDLLNLIEQQKYLNAQKDIQRREYALAGQDFEMHQKLEEEKVETRAEFREAQSKYLSKKAPLLQTEAALILAKGNYAGKEREILELINQITEQKSFFLQSLNSLLSQIEDWKSRYVISASQTGKLNYATAIQENQLLSTGEEAFYINPGNEQFFGKMSVTQDNIGKVKEGQQVLIKLKSYPFEQYGMLRGYVSHIADVPYRDSCFSAKVSFNVKERTDMKFPIHLKHGMNAEAEIITLDATILQRLSWNFLKLMKGK